MSSNDPGQQYSSELNRIRHSPIPESDKEAIIEFLRAKNENDFTVTGDGEKLSESTLATYGQCLRVTSDAAEEPLTETTTDTINLLMQSLLDGSHDSVSNNGLSKNTVIQRQSALRKFYRFHDDFGVVSEDIIITTRPEPAVDDRDIFTKEDIEAMRNSINNTRDRCLFELLINTGQRIRAIQTLRIKDVDVDEGVYYLNGDDGGLKGASKTGMKRPLLGAKRAVYDWLKHHPCPEDPEAYLITCVSSATRGTPGNKLHQTQINRIIKGIATDAGINKPKNAHQFRHFFVTSAKRDYNLDNDTIKHLIGHTAESKVMETTYSHLTDEDHIKAAEIGAGIREEEDESPLSPPVCPTCSEPLPENAKACPSCGTVFTPDAKAAMDEARDDLSEMMGEVLVEEERDALKQFREFVVNEMDPDMIIRMMDEENYPDPMDVVGEEESE